MTEQRENQVFGDFLLDRRQHRLFLRDRVVELPPRALALLMLLAGDPGMVFRRDALIEQLWDDPAEVTDGALSQVVLMLRRGLGTEGREFIRTVAKIGYAFEGDIAVQSEAGMPSQDSPTGSPQTGRSGSAASPVTISVPRRGLRRRFLMRIGASLFVALSMGFFLHRHFDSTSADRQPTLKIAGIHATSTGAGSQPAPTWAADALFDLVAAQLRGHRGIEMRNRADLDGSEGGTEALRLEGEVSRSRSDAGKVDIQWVLVRASQRLTWSDTVRADRLFDAVAALQETLARRFPQLDIPSMRHRAPTDSALIAYAGGIRAIAENRMPEARASLERALQAAPDFVLARHALANVLIRLGYRDLGLSHARRALEVLVPDDEAYPLVADQLLALLNRYAEAAVQARRLVLRQPADVEWRLLLTSDLIAAAQLEEAGQVLDALDPQRLSPRWHGRWLSNTIRLAIARGRLDEANENAKRLQVLADREKFADLGAEAAMAGADILNRQGRFAEGYALRQRAIAGFERANAPYEALRARALQLGSGTWAGIALTDDDYASVRDEARRLGNPEVEAGVEFALANRCSAKADFAGQRAHLLASRDLLLRLGSHPWLPTNAAALSESDTHLDRLDLAWSRLTENPAGADGDRSERWRLTRAAALVRRQLNDLPGTQALIEQAQAQAAAEQIDVQARLQCEVHSIASRRTGFEKSLMALKACVDDLASADNDEDRAWRVNFMAALAALESRAGARETAKVYAREATDAAWALGSLDRADPLLLLAETQAVAMPADEANASITATLAEDWAQTARRERAELLALRAIVAFGAGRPADGRRDCDASRQAAPSLEGLLGDWVDICSLAGAGHDDVALEKWMSMATRRGDAALLQLGSLAMHLPTPVGADASSQAIVR